jgi:diaminohydroxyphosphoribosylaminopyrimidine deaminase/5-amino-6-(5-phosphoribosylamino)uracil reductase
MVERTQYVLLLDRHLRTPLPANIVSDGAVETIIFTLESQNSKNAFLDKPLVTIEEIPYEANFINEILRRFVQKGIMTLFVEGGSRVHSSFIDAGLADELYLYMAPKLNGNGPSLFMNVTRNIIAESESLRLLDMKKVGEDVRLHAHFLKEE